jgi:hypothetical protein
VEVRRGEGEDHDHANDYDDDGGSEDNSAGRGAHPGTPNVSST